MNKVSSNGRLCAIAVMAFSAAFLVVPYASADIVGIKTATGPCSPTGTTQGGGTICFGNTSAFSLRALENGSESLQAVVGTQTAPVYLVDNNTGRTSFSLTFNGGLASNQFLTCQENGAFAGDSCQISRTLGTVGTGAQYGPPAGLPSGQYWNPGATLTFTGVGAGDFDIAFSSFGNGARGTVTGMPDSSSTLTLLATDLSPIALFGLVSLLRKSTRKAS